MDIVVVDDGSPDAEVTAIATQLGLRHIRNEVSRGTAAARNLGISSLSTRWILNFDHDNVASPRFVERLFRAAVRGERVGVSYSRPLLCGQGRGPHPEVRRALPWQLARENFIDASSLFLRDAWARAGGFDPQASPVSDWDFWLGIVEQGWRLAFVPNALWWYRVHSDSVRMTAKSEDVERAARYIFAKHASFTRAGRGSVWRPLQMLSVWMRRPLDRVRIEVLARTTAFPEGL